jgi:hypothetical protein
LTPRPMKQATAKHTHETANPEKSGDAKPRASPGTS